MCTKKDSTNNLIYIKTFNMIILTCKQQINQENY